jgi:hypothetical protein
MELLCFNNKKLSDHHKIRLLVGAWKVTFSLLENPKI